MLRVRTRSKQDHLLDLLQAAQARGYLLVVHVETTDEPYTMDYHVNILAEDDVIKVTFRLGFRIEQRINLFFRKVVEDMVLNKEVDITKPLRIVKPAEHHRGLPVHRTRTLPVARKQPAFHGGTDHENLFRDQKHYYVGG
jgi:K+ transporter